VHSRWLLIASDLLLRGVAVLLVGAAVLAVLKLFLAS
jgi:hypothetical protein